MTISAGSRGIIRTSRFGARGSRRRRRLAPCGLGVAQLVLAPPRREELAHLFIWSMHVRAVSRRGGGRAGGALRGCAAGASASAGGGGGGGGAAGGWRGGGFAEAASGAERGWSAALGDLQQRVNRLTRAIYVCAQAES